MTPSIARIALGSLVLLGCATPGPEWTRGGATPLDLNQDRYDCQQRHTTSTFAFGIGGGYRPRLDEDLFRSCMRARGWAHRDD